MLVIRGEAGIGKTALLRYGARQASGFRVAQIAGVEAEMELPFAGRPSALRADARPARRAPGAAARRAERRARPGAPATPPDRFLVALAVLSLLSAVAEERPLLCLVDDAQWLDAASSQVLGFVARRLLAESVAIVFAVREPARGATSTACPSCALGGLDDEDARALLARAVPGRLDDRVRDRIVAETRGNPLALLELPRRHERGRAGRRLRASRRGRSPGPASRTTTCGASARCPRRRSN